MTTNMNKNSFNIFLCFQIRYINITPSKTKIYNHLDIFYYKILFIQLEVIIICFSLSPRKFQITKRKPLKIIHNLCYLSSNIREKTGFDSNLLLTH